MQSVFLQFETGLSELRKHVVATGLLDDAVSICSSSPPTTEVERKLMAYINYMDGNSRKKRFEYNSVVISLFGIFETFIEGLLRAYLDTLRATHTRYSQLPEAFKTQHLRLSIDLMSRLHQTRYNGKVTTDILISKLSSCLSNKRTFLINEESFLNHGANFRASVIGDYFAKAGIPDLVTQAIKDGTINKFLTSNALDFSGLGLIDRIADIRNEIAHGETCNVEDRQYQLQYIDYVEEVGRSIFKVIQSASINVEVDRKGKRLTRLYKTFGQNIVSFKPTPIDIESYDYLAFKDGDGTWYKEKILSMRSGDQDVTSSKRGDPVGVGIKLNARVRKGWKYFLLRGTPPVQVVAPEPEMTPDEYFGSAVEEEIDAGLDESDEGQP